MSEPLLRALVDLRDRQIQKARIQFSNRLSAIDRATDDAAGSGQRATVERWLDVFTTLESQLDKDIKTAVKDMPVFQEMNSVKGIGPLISAKIISMVEIDRADTVSALWRYAGYGVVNGEREKPVKGEKLHYNKRLKTTLYLAGSSFLKCGSPYRQIYDSSKAQYEATKPDWTKAHIHSAAMRRMIKMFLSHLWQRWRELEGLPTRAPYVNDHLGHTHIYTPQEFGWPEPIEPRNPG